MPRYFFHVQDGEDKPDEIGLTLSGSFAARNEAIAAASDMLKDCTERYWAGDLWQMLVLDEHGGTVCRLRFSADLG